MIQEQVGYSRLVFKIKRAYLMDSNIIDLHCHILPGVDDGAKTFKDSLDMAKKAVEQGITHILCTPHHRNGVYSNPASKVIPLVNELQENLTLNNLPIKILSGQEIRLNGNLLEEISEKEILFIDPFNIYLLIEFPTNIIPLYAKDTFFKLRSAGHVPVIVHPERNSRFREDPNLLLPFLKMGCLAQLTAPSYVGVFGKSIQKIAKVMIQHNFIHLIASDAHRLQNRDFYLKEAFEKVEKDFGIEKAESLKQAARDMAAGDFIDVEAPLEIKSKKKGFYFFKKFKS